MKLTNEFAIDVAPDLAWKALNDPQLVAPCFPGASLTTYETDSFSGTVKVKLGPISLTYKGEGTYVERREDERVVLISARGRDARGNGTAEAIVTARIEEAGPDRSRIEMVTDLSITGRPAQFGRGVISDVADSMIGKFAACVADKLAADGTDATGPISAVPASTISFLRRCWAAGARDATSTSPHLSEPTGAC